MKILINFAVVFTILALPVLAACQTKTDWPNEITVVVSKRNQTVSVEGDLSKGTLIEDLSWAWSSSNACFPGTQAQKFMGNHVLFATIIPTRSVMTVKVIPEDQNANVSLYAYSIGTSDFSVVPDLSRSVTCEADHKWDRPWKGKTQDHTRWVELNAIDNPFNVVIGVTAPKGMTAGKFRLEVTVKS